MSTRRRLVAIVSAVLALVFALVWWRQSHALDDEGSAQVWTPAASGTPANSTAATVSSPSGSAKATATPGAGTPTPLPQGCSSATGPIEATRFQVPRLDVDSGVLHVGLQDGAIGVPPKDDPVSVGYWTGSPAPGSRQGHTVMTTHTYHAGGALGNKLYSAGGLKPGDLVKLRDAQGRTVCYRYTGATKVWVKDYDPASTVIVDAKGKPQLVLVICWDYVAKTKFWGSRIVFNFEPLAA